MNVKTLKNLLFIILNINKFLYSTIIKGNNFMKTIGDKMLLLALLIDDDDRQPNKNYST